MEAESAGEATPPQPADAELVRRAKAGDLTASETLATRHEARIYNVASRITGNEHDAEDVTQQAFLNALEHLDGFREEASFAIWLQRIATHAALKVLRKRKGLPWSNTPSRRKATKRLLTRNSSPIGASHPNNSFTVVKPRGSSKTR